MKYYAETKMTKKYKWRGSKNYNQATICKIIQTQSNTAYSL